MTDLPKILPKVLVIVFSFLMFIDLTFHAQGNFKCSVSNNEKGLV